MSQFALEITDLKKTYDSDVVALKGINLTVQEGDFFALLGPNEPANHLPLELLLLWLPKLMAKLKFLI